MAKTISSPWPKCFAMCRITGAAKSVHGLDCSGLVQLALEACGIACPRDTDMQERDLGVELPINDLDGLKRGDLVFWDGHVGIMADERHPAACQWPSHADRDRAIARSRRPDRAELRTGDLDQAASVAALTGPRDCRAVDRLCAARSASPHRRRSLPDRNRRRNGASPSRFGWLHSGLVGGQGLGLEDVESCRMKFARLECMREYPLRPAGGRARH